jgi:P63C domain
MIEKKIELTGRAKGGALVAANMTPEERKNRASKGALARWGAKMPKATHKGNFKEEFGFDAECYVLGDESKTAVISQRGMGIALGLSEGGSRFPTFIRGEKIAPYVGHELSEKLQNPLIFQSSTVGVNAPAVATKANGYDAAVLIDVCHAIIAARKAGSLLKRQSHIADQAQIIVNASAKAGIKGLVYALAGYRPEVEEVIQAFKVYVQEEAKKYEQEFPNELYMAWQRLYKIPLPERGKPWQFMHLTRRHIYYPLAKSNGKILELVKALKAKDGDQKKKLFQFLNDVGARALRMQIGRVLEMSESSKGSREYEEKIIERFGGQIELELVFPQTP